jgi:hypothetical protein
MAGKGGLAGSQITLKGDIEVSALILLEKMAKAAGKLLR